MDFFERLVTKVTILFKVIAFPVKCSCYVLGFLKFYISLFNFYNLCLIPRLPPPCLPLTPIYTPPFSFLFTPSHPLTVCPPPSPVFLPLYVPRLPHPLYPSASLPQPAFAPLYGAYLLVDLGRWGKRSTPPSPQFTPPQFIPPS